MGFVSVPSLKLWIRSFRKSGKVSVGCLNQSLQLFKEHPNMLCSLAKYKFGGILILYKYARSQNEYQIDLLSTNLVISCIPGCYFLLWISLLTEISVKRQVVVLMSLHSMSLQSTSGLINAVSKEVPTKSLEEISQHNQWYTEYLTLKENKKKAIEEWREQKKVK